MKNQNKPPPQKKKRPEISWVLGPGEFINAGWPPYPYYQCQPPYCTPSRNNNWRAVTKISVREKSIEMDDRVTAVSRWVEQVIREELGYALVTAEKQAKRRCVISVSNEVADLIHRALELEANARYK